MSIIQDVLAAAWGGIKERDDEIASLKVEREGHQTAAATMASDLQAAQQLVSEAAGKEVAYNQAIEDYDRVVSHCSSLASWIAASKASAHEFAAEFGFVMSPDAPVGKETAEGADPGEADAVPAADVADDGDHEPDAQDEAEDAADDGDDADDEETEATVEPAVDVDEA